MTQRIAVIGGGIIGLSCAWYLSRRGHHVTVIDRGTIGGGCSQSNCGLICPSHVLPLAEPGVLRAGIAAIFRPRGPLRLSLRPDRRRWSWYWWFARRSNRAAMMESARAIQPLLESSMRQFQDWTSREGLECQWQQKGLLFVYRNPAEWRAFASTNELLDREFSEPARRLGSAEVRELEPALNRSVCGGWYYPHDAHLRPDLLLGALRRRMEATGRVQFHENRGVVGLEGEQERCQRIVCADGARLPIDAVVVATGAHAPEFESALGMRLPVQPGKGYSLTLPAPGMAPAIPMIFPERRVAVTPFSDSLRLGSVMEFVGFDAQIPPWRMAYLRTSAVDYLQANEIGSAPEASRWFGWRPMTPDSVPIIDRSSRWGNAWVATGHNMLGLSMAPATGKLLAEMVDGEQPHLDPTPYRWTRFARGR